MPDVFLHLPKSLTSRPSNQLSQCNVTVLYLIPGNPGLIEYYFPFLNLLVEQSKEWNDDDEKHVIIAGASLGGFEAVSSSTLTSVSTATSAATPSAVSEGSTEAEILADCEASKESLLPLYPSSFTKTNKTGTYTLQDQISLTYARINTLIEKLSQRLSPGHLTTKPVNIILAGHSVGAYIALEVIRKHHTSLSRFKDTPTSSLPSPHWSITSTLLLTPTISNIALSPSGRIATPLLGYLPFLPRLLQLGASGLTGCLSRSWMCNVVGRITGMKNPDMIDVTVNFLGRPGSVRQALEMAGHEMREITEGSWDEAVWGATATGEGEGDGQVAEVSDVVKPGENGDVTWKAPKHYFLFAKEDHWVADETREVILGRMHGRAKILVDGVEGEDGVGIVHDWCLEQSVIVAGIVSGWMREILGSDLMRR